MTEFLKVQYKLGKITDEQLKALVSVTITAEQYKYIVGE
jgi:hypothetical protein